LSSSLGNSKNKRWKFGSKLPPTALLQASLIFPSANTLLEKDSTG
jgi:hypothetical protein